MEEPLNIERDVVKNGVRLDCVFEGYAMRCWMLRLGFIGDEFATAREILLRNMEGNASWRNK